MDLLKAYSSQSQPEKTVSEKTVSESSSQLVVVDAAPEVKIREVEGDLVVAGTREVTLLP